MSLISRLDMGWPMEAAMRPPPPRCQGARASVSSRQTPYDVRRPALPIHTLLCPQAAAASTQCPTLRLSYRSWRSREGALGRGFSIEEELLYKETTEAAVAAIQSIMFFSERSGSVKRVIYTGSVTSTSPLKEDGTGFKGFIDESCWTPLGLSFEYCAENEKDYTVSKTLSEKEVLSYNNREDNRGIEVVSLVCGLVGGDALIPYVSVSVQEIVSPLTGDPIPYRQLKFLEALLGSVPLVHIEDVCEAHVFCMEMASMSGRFLCASANPTIQELVDYYQQKDHKLLVNEEFDGIKKTELRSTKLAEMGFKYNYEQKHIIDESVECAKRLGRLRGVVYT